MHNDTRTVTFSGGYEGQKSKEALGRPPLITFGHNKDHRPDLKQLVYSLTISSDGAVPVHYKTYDGNTTDDQTHIETWKIVRSIRGSSDFMYVADSKLCTRKNMRFIDDEGGRFVTTVPRSRKEDDDFRSYLQTNTVPWQEVFRKKAPDDSDKPDQVYEAVELAMTSGEGFRLVWYRSSVKTALDEKRRLKKIMRARERLEQLADRSGAHAFRSIDRARQAADRVLEEEGAKHWLAVDFSEKPLYDLKQIGPGRPGRETEYRRVQKGVRIVFHIEENVDVIQADARCDGIFAMMTNDRSQSPAELLVIYKYQPFLEKRNEQLKSVLSVAPVFLKKPERVAALLFVYFLAVLIFALIEREILLSAEFALGCGAVFRGWDDGWRASDRSVPQCARPSADCESRDSHSRFGTAPRLCELRDSS
jgi:transposase